MDMTLDLQLEAQAAILALDHDGATYELLDGYDGRSLLLTIESDQDISVNDFDCYGRVEWVDDRQQNDYGYPVGRPAGFDGNAEKLHVGRGCDACWWQPPAGSDRGTVEFRDLRQLVEDVLEYGFATYVVELREGTDHYGRPIVIDSESLGGVEPGPVDTYIVDQLVADILSRIEETER